MVEQRDKVSLNKEPNIEPPGPRAGVDALMRVGRRETEQVTTGDLKGFEKLV